jgi:hypothetical protein
VSKIVDAWSSMAWAQVQAETSDQGKKDRVDRLIDERASSKRDEYVVVRTGNCGSTNEILLECCIGARMQRDKAALSKLGFADYETVRCDVVEPQ